MVYNQDKNGNSLRFEFKEDGINYTLKDKSIHKTEFIPFESITNKTHEFFERNDGHKQRAIYFLIVGTLFLIANLVLQTKLWAWLFLIGAPIFYYLYKKSIVNYKVINTQDNMDIYILNDNNEDDIFKAIYNKRNEYLVNTYLSINYSNDPLNEISKFLWLKSLEVINNKEFEVIKEEITLHHNLNEH